MTWAMINPGSGYVEGSDVRTASRNVRAFCREVSEAYGVKVSFRRKSKYDDLDNGRFSWDVTVAGVVHTMLMPGCSIELLRTEGLVPRLYVDGNSWWWRFAVSVVRPEEGR